MKCYKWPHGTMDKVSAYGAGDSGTSPAGSFLLMQSAATSPRGSDSRASRVRERKRRPINRSNANHNPTCTRKTFTETGSFGLGIAAIGGGIHRGSQPYGAIWCHRGGGAWRNGSASDSISKIERSNLSPFIVAVCLCMRMHV